MCTVPMLFRVALLLGSFAWVACQVRPCGSSKSSESKDSSQNVPPPTAPKAKSPDTPLDANSLDPPLGANCPDPSLADARKVTYVCECDEGADADCQAGDDAADGRSPDTAKRTYEAARSAFVKLPMGGAVAFCRGGAFAVNGDRRWVNDDCRAETPCIVRDYHAPWASGDEGPPLLSATTGAVFAFEDPGKADPEEGVQLLNLELRGAHHDSPAVFFFNDIDDVLLCGLVISRFSIGVQVAGSLEPSEGSNGKNERIELRNSLIFDNASLGWLGGCDGCGVRGSRFTNNGFGRAIFNHTIYFGGNGNDMFAIGNVLYRSTIVDGRCQGVSFVVHGVHEGLLIEGNIVREDIGAADNTCYGITVSPAYAEAESFADVVIRGNHIVNTGRVAIGLAGCRNCVVENNVVIHGQPMGATLITTDVHDVGVGDSAADANIVRNNSLLALNGEHVVGVSVGGAGSNHVVVNNAFHYTASGRAQCFAYELDDAAHRQRDGNLCWAPSGSLDWANGQDLADWQSRGADGASLVADPLFKSIEAPFDLTPRVSSPVRDAGVTELASIADIDGEARDSAPDIGAYELR